MSHLYIHIPFCAQRCAYCDFTASTDLAAMPQYVEALCKELELLYRRYPMPIKTLYFGGGTPSLLSLKSFEQIYQTIARTFGAPLQEFTVEVNPESTRYRFIAGLTTFGVNRISMGMQAYQDDLLKVLDRKASYRQTEQAVDIINRCGISNYNIDCIYGIPGQTLDDVAETVQRIVDLRAKHVSAYALKLESNVPLAKRIKAGQFTMPNDDLTADMLDLIIDQLAAAAIARYEVSNFAALGYHSRHNSAYWSAADTLGAGLGAAYKVAANRYYNTVQMTDYLKCVADGQLPVDSARTEALSAEDSAYEYAILNLRTTQGIDLAQYTRLFGCDFTEKYCNWIKEYRAYGVLLETQYGYKLNRRGLDIANYILSDL